MFAIQILFDGNWQYVLDAAGQQVQQYEFKETAERVAAGWRKPNHGDAVRVVPYK